MTSSLGIRSEAPGQKTTDGASPGLSKGRSRRQETLELIKQNIVIVAGKIGQACGSMSLSFAVAMRLIMTAVR